MFKNDQILMLVVAFLLGYFMRQMFSGVVEGLECYDLTRSNKVTCIPEADEGCLRPTDSALGWGCSCGGRNHCCQDGSIDIDNC